MKNYLILIIGLTFFFGSNVHAQKWIRYQSKSARLQADFPVNPEEKIEDTDKAKTYTATVTHDGYEFTASAMLYKTNLNVKGLSQETLAKTSLDAFEKNLGATKVMSKNYYYRQDVGLDAEIDTPDYDNTILYRVIVVGKTRYEISVMKKSGKAKYGLMKKFLNSFKILK